MLKVTNTQVKDQYLNPWVHLTLGSWEGQGSRVKEGNGWEPCAPSPGPGQSSTTCCCECRVQLQLQGDPGHTDFEPQAKHIPANGDTPSHTTTRQPCTLSRCREGRGCVCVGLRGSVCSRRRDSRECNEKRERLTSAQTRSVES